MRLRIAMACALGFGIGFTGVGGQADDSRRGKSEFGSRPGQEVVNGSYSCDGTVFTDEQLARIRAGSFLSATSGITSGLFPTAQSSSDVPADLDAMAKICDAHIAAVLEEVPSICTLGAVFRERGEFGNGASVQVHFDFSCQGGRNQVMGVIGGFSRLPLVTRLE